MLYQDTCGWCSVNRQEIAAERYNKAMSYCFSLWRQSLGNMKLFTLLHNSQRLCSAASVTLVRKVETGCHQKKEKLKTLSCLTEIVAWQRSWHVPANKGNGLRARRPGVAITTFLLSYRGNGIVVMSSRARQTDVLVPVWCEDAAASGYTGPTRW